MRVRNYLPSDRAAIERFYRSQGYIYALPIPDNKDILSCLVLESAGDIRAAAILRLEVNAMLLMDHRWQKPQVRLIALQELHEAARKKAEEAGIEHANAWIPPEIENQFGPRLMELNWEKCLWPSYTRRVNG
jgi:hypothetical protein